MGQFGLSDGQMVGWSVCMKISAGLKRVQQFEEEKFLVVGNNHGGGPCPTS